MIFLDSQILWRWPSLGHGFCGVLNVRPNGLG